ncbi:MAG: aminotransferase class V-fold PLP-dependent enzyme, partial [Clostridia bacterium]|nr:aminotransferase class V-fold PLP-dependent enzyme [Clostridia bacterium]
AVRPETALCVLTHASNVTGTLQPAGTLIAAAHRYGLPVLLDAAQTAGTVDIKDIGADMVAMPGHKGLLGPMGTGILWLGEHASPRPLREGGTGSASESVHQPDMLPDRYESGTLQLPAIAGLLQGVRFVRANGNAIHEYETYLIDKLRGALAAMPETTVYSAENTPHVGVLSFNVKDRECAEVADLLDQRGFCLRGGLHCAPCMHHWLGTQGTVRASVGPYTTEGEINQLIDAVKDIVKKQ